jgi:cell division protein FtsZ
MRFTVLFPLLLLLPSCLTFTFLSSSMSPVKLDTKLHLNSLNMNQYGKFDGLRTSTPLRSSASSTPPIIMPDGGISPCTIKVIGVGGGGSNAVDRMMETRVSGVEFWAVNTDAQALGRSKAKGARVLNVGSDVTRGLGAGGMPDVGRKAAEESRAEIAAMVEGADLVFVTAGMGGGTGSGAAPVVAEVAKESGALTVGVVTKPFGFEGRRRMTQAVGAISELRKCVDTVIVVSNDKLLEIIPANTPVERAFAVADDILRQGVVGISEIIVRPGLINVDFADVRSVMGNAGTALMGIGTGTGKTRAEDAALAAISSPLLDSPIDKASGIVFNVIGGRDMTLQEINKAAALIYDSVHPEANIIFGALVDPSIDDDSISITVLATGFKLNEAEENNMENSSTLFGNANRGPNSPSSPQPPKSPKSSPKKEGGGDIPDFLKGLKRR